jgi:CheY-like chemotaxis protein
MGLQAIASVTSRESRVPTPAAPQVESAGGGMILVVEDNPDVMEVSVSMLNQLGYEVHAVSSGDDALEAIGRHSFDLVVSDIVMAGAIDGIALARIIRERKPALPVLLVTGYNHAADTGTQEFTIMRKPFELADLSRTTARMIAAGKQPHSTNLVRLSDARRNTASR